MYLIEKVLGNINNPDNSIVPPGDYIHDVLYLEQWEAQKSSCRKKSHLGYDIGLSLERDVRLNNGDILLYNENDNYLLTVRIQLRRVMVVDFGRFHEGDEVNTITRIFELGHALGNQHWKAIIKGYCIFVPLVVNKTMFISVMKSHGYTEDKYYFTEGENILPMLTTSESRLLFGGAEEAHTHVDINH